jgi:hypothetical protein
MDLYCERCGRGPGVLLGGRRSASTPLIVPVKAGAATLLLCTICERTHQREEKRFAKARLSSIRLVPSD